MTRILKLARRSMLAATILLGLCTPSLAQNIAIPNVVGMDYHNAVPQLQAAGFKTRIEEAGGVAQQDPRFGKVASTNPQAGASAPKGTTVIVRIWALQSHAAPAAKVPAVVGAPVTVAAQKVLDLGLTFRLEFGAFVAPGDSRIDRIFEQIPKPGESVPQGSTVRLKKYFVLGICVAQPAEVEGGRFVCGVPNVVGMDYHKAIPELQKAGFKTRLEQAGGVAAQDPRLGKVVSTNPKYLEAATKDSTVVVKVWALQGK